MARQDKKHSRRGISKCPEPFAELLRNINLLPTDDAELKLFSKFLDDLIQETEIHLGKRPNKLDATREWYVQQINKSPNPDLCRALHEPFFAGRKAIFLPDGETPTGQSVPGELNAWIRDRSMLATIIASYKQTQDLSIRGLYEDRIRAVDTVTFGFNDDSTLKADGFRILEILLNYNVEVRRLGQCPICEKFYYAKKVVHQTCGRPKCAQAFCRPSTKRLKRKIIFSGR